MSDLERSHHLEGSWAGNRERTSMEHEIINIVERADANVAFRVKAGHDKVRHSGKDWKAVKTLQFSCIRKPWHGHLHSTPPLVPIVNFLQKQPLLKRRPMRAVVEIWR